MNKEKNEGAQPAPPRMTSEDRRRQLIQIALRLFSQNGFRGTTTKEIALAAGVNEAIIFRHFETKDDLYAAILDFKAREVNVDQWFAEVKQFAESRDDEGLFRSFATKVLEHHRIDKAFLRLMLYSALEGHDLARNFREKHFKPVHEFLRDYIIERQREGAYLDCNPDAAVRAFVGSLNHHALITTLFDSDFFSISDDDAIKNFTRLFLCGLRSTHPSRLEAQAGNEDRR